MKTYKVVYRTLKTYIYDYIINAELYYITSTFCYIILYDMALY